MDIAVKHEVKYFAPPAGSIPPVTARATTWLTQALLLVASMAASGVASVLLGQDANWDLQNYHFYNAWAFLNDRLGWDYAPAQLQSFLNPVIEVPFYWMIATDWPPRLVAFVMGLPGGVGAFFLAKILLRIFGKLPPKQRWLYVMLAFIVGICASGPVSLLGSTMNEWQGASLVMAALWVLLSHRRNAGPTPWRAIAGAGLLCGIASGLKLTAATYAVGLCAALLLQPPVLWRGFREAAGFGVATMLGVLATLGPWMWALYEHFGNPLFPYFNEFFRSPWWDQAPLLSRTFGPHSVIEWLTFPLRMLHVERSFVTEGSFRDWRLPILYLAFIAGVIGWLIERMRGGRARTATGDSVLEWKLITVFWCVSFVIWTAVYSIYRYLVPLELLSGALIIQLLRWSVPIRWLALATTMATAAAVFTVHYPDWGRIPYGRHYFQINAPPIAPHAVVLMINDEPMAYVLPFFPSDGRFLSVKSNFNSPQRRNRFEYEIARIVREHDGPLYSLSFPAVPEPQVLDAHGLRIASSGCAKVITNMPTSPLELCRLERTLADDARR